MTYRETQKGVMAGIRARLGRPPLDVITNQVLFEHLLDEEEHLNTRLKLTSQNWILRYVQVSVDVNKDKIPVSDKAPLFGRADLVETVDNGAPDYRRRVIEHLDLQDVGLHWSGYKPLQGDTLYPHNARQVAFWYDEETQLKMAWFTPLAFAPADYGIYYEPSHTEARQLLDKPGFPLTLFYNKLKVDTSCALLGLLAECLKEHQRYDKDVFAELKESLYGRKQEYDEGFDRYILQDSEDQAGYIQPFNSSRRPNSEGGF